MCFEQHLFKSIDTTVVSPIDAAAARQELEVSHEGREERVGSFRHVICKVDYNRARALDVLAIHDTY